MSIDVDIVVGPDVPAEVDEDVIVPPLAPVPPGVPPVIRSRRARAVPRSGAFGAVLIRDPNLPGVVGAGSSDRLPELPVPRSVVGFVACTWEFKVPDAAVQANHARFEVRRRANSRAAAWGVRPV